MWSTERGHGRRAIRRAGDTLLRSDAMRLGAFPRLIFTDEEPYQ
jgi:hypothetical protein